MTCPFGVPTPFGTAQAIPAMLGAALLIYGLLGLERSGALRLPGWVKLAGAASYVLYLLHEPRRLGQLRLVAKVASWPLPAGATLLVVAVLTIAASVAVNIRLRAAVAAIPGPPGSTQPGDRRVRRCGQC